MADSGNPKPPKRGVYHVGQLAPIRFWIERDAKANRLSKSAGVMSQLSTVDVLSPAVSGGESARRESVFIWEQVRLIVET